MGFFISRAENDSRTRDAHAPPPLDTNNKKTDGSSTAQAPGTDSEVYLIPRAIFRDPFRGGKNILVMCDCYEPPKVLPDGTMAPPVAIPTNTRAACAEAMDKAKGESGAFVVVVSCRCFLVLSFPGCFLVVACCCFLVLSRLGWGGGGFVFGACMRRAPSVLPSSFTGQKY
jgi:hypothetical protein